MKRLVLHFLLLLPLTYYASAQELETSRVQKDASPLNIVELEIQGITRTDKDWFIDFLDLENLPKQLKPVDFTNIRLKILTTGSFYNVLVNAEPVLGKPNNHKLVIRVDEAWTAIPVVRGAYGGGEPLKVFGFYNTHTFGRLLTTGLETRKYGDADNSYIAWLKAPQAIKGKYDLGVEVWDLKRKNLLYDDEFEETGDIELERKYVRGYAYMPLNNEYLEKFVPLAKLQLGVDVVVQRKSWEQDLSQASGALRPNATDVSQLTPRNETDLLPTLIYDDIVRYGAVYDGLRTVTKSGVVGSKNKLVNKTELEAFYYKRLPLDHNFASHFFAAQNDYVDVSNEYFLGGLDAIRGIPEGVYRGRKAVYVNLELRRQLFEARYFILQTLLFSDIGAAQADWDKVASHHSWTGGVGLRFSLPQVPRLMLRIDYAWDLKNKKPGGIAAGMNQFFQPYKPL